MNRFIALLLSIGVISVFSQNQVDKQWEKARKEHRFLKDKKYKPEYEYYDIYPEEIHGDNAPKVITQKEDAIEYDEDKIRRFRNIHYGKYGTPDGRRKIVDNLKQPDPITLPEIDPPEIDPPDIPNVDAPDKEFWKTIFTLLIIAVIGVILYFFFKNFKPKDAVISSKRMFDWNPHELSKDQLQLKLEDALKDADFRLAVRIWFTTILKELIEQKKIVWHKEKTNHLYVHELFGKTEYNSFRECVRVYDLIWYGEYAITEKEYKEVLPILQNTMDLIKNNG